MSTTAEEVQRAIDRATAAGDGDAVAELTGNLKDLQSKPALDRKAREDKILQLDYERDAVLPKPSQSELQDFRNKNLTSDAPGGGVLGDVNLRREVVKDPFSGQVRWAALSPERMKQVDETKSKKKATVAALKSGFTRWTGERVQDVDAGIRRREITQKAIFNELGTNEQHRVERELKKTHGSMAIEKIPPYDFRKVVEQNPDNEKLLDDISGDEWGAERTEFWKRIGNRLLTPTARGINLTGADDPTGAISGAGRYKGIEYGEGEQAPLYAGASSDIRDWKSESRYAGGGLYDYLIKPFFTKDGVLPGDRILEAAEMMKKKGYSPELAASVEKRFFPEGKGIEDIFSAEMWNDPNTKLPWNDWDGFTMTVLENLPQIGVGMIAGRLGGRVGARMGAQQAAGQTLMQIDKTRRRGAGLGGMLGGGSTEGLLIHDNVASEIRSTLNDVSMDKFEKDQKFQQLIGAGLTPEEAKQLLIDDAARWGGKTGFVLAGMLAGAPMGWFFGRAAAGRISGGGTAGRVIKGALGEPVQEGTQEVIEGDIQDVAIASVDPENPIFKDKGRRLERFGGGFFISAPTAVGAFGAAEPSTPKGLEQEDKDVMQKTSDYMTATDKRYAFEIKITSPDYIADTEPQKRLADMQELERLQKEEAELLMAAEPTMREYLEKQDTLTASTELKMLNALKMRANVVLTDIEVARSRRQTSAEMVLEQQAIMNERNRIQHRVTKNLMKLEDVKRLSANIEAVQNQEGLSEQDYAELLREGYGRWAGPNKDHFVIRPKGRRALNLLNQQERDLSKKLEVGYTGPERRQPENQTQRDRVDSADPVAREQLINTDPLTGLQNRRAFDERAQDAPAYAAVDVDSLAWVNDNMSHASGDRLLLAIADAIEKQKGVEVFRLGEGGDEFAVTGASQEALETALQAAKKELDETPIIFGEDEVSPQISWGKGRTYEEADQEAGTMKKERVRRGIVAERKEKPTTYKARKQQKLLLHQVAHDLINQYLDRMIKGGETYDDAFRFEKATIAPPLERLSKEERQEFDFYKEQQRAIETEPASKRKQEKAERRAGRGSEEARRYRERVALREDEKHRTRIRRISSALNAGRSVSGIAKSLKITEDEVYEALDIATMPEAEKRAANLAERKRIKAATSKGEATEEARVKPVPLTGKGLFQQRGVPVPVPKQQLVFPPQYKIAENYLRAEIEAAQGNKDQLDSFGLYGSVDSDVAKEILRMISAIDERPSLEALASFAREYFGVPISRQHVHNIYTGNTKTVPIEKLNAVMLSHSMLSMTPWLMQYDALPTDWRNISSIVQRGNTVEVLTPDGAVHGVVTKVVRRKKKPRITVTIEGNRNFTFNPLRNHLITAHSNRADIAWLTGDASYINPDRETIPQTINSVMLGHVLDKQGIYADLARFDMPHQKDLYSDSKSLTTYNEDYWSNEYPEWSTAAPFVYKLPEASDEEMAEAEGIVSRLTSGYSNLPPITLIRSMEQLQEINPSLYQRLKDHPGASLSGVRGFFDEEVPENGVVIMVMNTPKYGAGFEANLSETVLHEIIGHYGIRGVFGNEVELRSEMHKIVKAFPKVAAMRKYSVPREPGMSDEAYDQLLGEEMIAYITGEMMAGTITLTPPQRTAIQKFFDWVRSWFSNNRWQSMFPEPSKDNKYGFWNDEKIQQLIARAQDFVRNGNGFSFDHLDGTKVRLMRDADIFQLATIQAVNEATRKLNKEQRRSLEAKYPEGQAVPKEVPLFDEIGSPNKYKSALDVAKKPVAEGGFGITAKELELVGLSNKADEFNFLRDSTYKDLRSLSVADGQVVSSDWYKAIMPPVLAEEYETIVEIIMSPENFVNPKQRANLLLEAEERMNEILATTIDQKKTQISKDLLMNYLASQKVVTIRIAPGSGYPQISDLDAAKRLFGNDVDQYNLTADEQQMVQDEVLLSRQRGYNIGFDPTLGEWFDRQEYAEYSDSTPQGADFGGDYRVAFIIQEGGGLPRGHTGHFNGQEGVLVHIRTGVAEVFNMVEGQVLPIAPNVANAGKLLSLIEMQADWLQNLRKSYRSADERDQADIRRPIIRQTIRQAGLEVASTIEAHVVEHVKKALTPIANLPQGSWGSEFREYIRQEYGVFGTAIEEGLTEQQQEEAYRTFRNKKLDEITLELEYVHNDLRDAFEGSGGAVLGDLPGTFDARMFEQLDKYLGVRIANNLREDVFRLKDRINQLKNTTTQERFVNELTDTTLKNVFHKLHYGFREGMSGGAEQRLPVATNELKKILKVMYDAFGMSEGDSKIDSMLESIQTRKKTIYKIPMDNLRDYARAMEVNTDDLILVDTMKSILANVRLLDHGVNPNKIDVDVSYAPSGNSIDIQVIGSESGIEEFDAAFNNLITSWIDEDAVETRARNIRDKQASALLARGQQANTYTPGEQVAFDDLVNEWGLHQIDVEESSPELELHDVGSYDEWSEEVMQNTGMTRYKRRMNEVIQNHLDALDWSTVETPEGEPMTSDADTYQNLLIRNDQDVVTSSHDAETWLTGKRDQYKEELEYEDEIVEQVDSQMKAEWEEDPTYLTYGYLPTTWDQNGDVTGSVNFVMKKTEWGGMVSATIDEEEVESYSYHPEAENNIWRDIEIWYDDKGITPPPGKLFGQPPPPGLGGKTNEELEAEHDRLSKLPDPNWSIIKSALTDGATAFPDERGENTAKMFEELVRLTKIEGQGINTDTPLRKDDYWRAMGLNYLLADAVRRGLPGIIWNPGLATSARGGASFTGTATSRITWSLEAIEIRGKTEEVWVISSPDMAKPIVVAKANSVPILAGDVAGYISQQIAGKKPLSSRSTDEEGNVTSTTADDFIIARVGETEHHTVNDRNDGSLINMAASREEAETFVTARVAADALVSPASGYTPIGQPVMQGEVTEEDIGGKIRIITGKTTPDFAHTYKVPTLAGARTSYEQINIKIWNKILKQYGVQIGEIVIKAGNIERAERREGARIVESPHRAALIENELGGVSVEELQGEAFGFIVMSEKEGPLAQHIYPSREEAEEQLKYIIQNRFGSIEGGIKSFFIPVNEKIRERFSKGPMPPFHYDPRQDPRLKEAAAKIGYEGTTLMERYREWKEAWKDNFHQGMFDRFYGIKRAVRKAEIDSPAETDPYIQTRLTTSLDSVMKAVLEYGHPVWKDGIVQTEGKGLLDVLQPVMNNIELWSMYMAGVRAKRLLSEGREKLWTEDEIDAMVELGEAYPVFKRVAADYAVFNKKVLDFAEEAGVVNPETRSLWENADYVPFYRVEDERLVGPLSGGAGVANQKSPIKRLKGGDANVGDITHNIFVNLTKLIDTSMKNNAALLAVDALRGSGIISKKPMTHSQEIIPLQQVKKLLMDRGMNPDTIPDEALTGFQRMFAVQPPSGPGVISVLRAGKKEFYYTDDELLYRSMTNINKKAWGRWMNLFRAPKRLLTTLVTLDPGFMIANFIRDSQSAFVMSRDKFIPIAAGIKGFGQALVKDEAMRTMLSAGAAFESGYINQYDPDATHKMIKKAMKKKSFARTVLNSPAKLFEAWKALGSAAENANRIAVYNASIRAGKGKAQAAFEAKDLMDFSMGGDWPFIQFLIQSVPFMGARMQGLHRLGRGFTEHPVAFTMKGSLVGIAGIALYFAFKDDERYKELEDWDKDTYFHWWIGDNHYRLPKGFEVGAIFNTIPERIFGYMDSQENDAGKLLMKRWAFMMAETFNFNPVPQTFRPMMESYFNYNFFTGRRITSPYEEDRLSPEEYRYMTSPSMVELARALPGGLDTASTKIRSPLHLENLFRGYTGTLGRYFMMAADEMVRSQMNYPLPPDFRTGDYPVTGRFIRGDEPRRTRYEEEVYKLIRKTSEIQGSLRFLERADEEMRFEDIETEWEPYIAVAEDLEDIREDVSDINRAIMQIYQDDDLDPADKRKQIDDYQAEKNQLFELGYKLRPGGELNPQATITEEQIIDFIDNFGVDEQRARRLEDTNPETFDLANSVLQLNKRDLESLSRQR